MDAEAERIAKLFHDAYETLAPQYGYRTRDESRVPWDVVPLPNRELMIATVHRLLERGVIRGPARCEHDCTYGQCSLSEGHDQAHQHYRRKT